MDSSPMSGASTTTTDKIGAGKNDFEEGLKVWLTGKMIDCFAPLEKSAALGYPPASLLLHRFYAGGLGSPKTDELLSSSHRDKAAANFQFFKEAVLSEPKEPKFHFFLAYCYDFGIGVAVNEAEGLKYFKIAAEKDFSPAQHVLGHRYLDGSKGVKEDPQEALYLLHKACDQGFPPTLAKMAFYYDHGIPGIEPNIHVAMRFYQEAADKGDVMSQFGLGFLYHHGRGDDVDRDLTKALFYYEMACEQRFPRALILAGLLLASDQPEIPKNPSLAFKYFKTASDDDFPDGHYHVGVCYQEASGIEKDEKKAVEYFRLSADKGCAHAQFDLAHCYFQATGDLPRDNALGIKYLSMAADQDHPKALYSIAVFHQYGDCGLEVDKKKAFDYFMRSADQGFDQAQHSLGLVFEGKHPVIDIVPKNLATAAYFHSQAARKGHPAGQFHYASLLSAGVPASGEFPAIPKNESAAIELYKASAEQGYPNALCVLALLYRNGIGVPKNEELGVKYLISASKAGSPIAQYNLGSLYATGHEDIIPADKKIAFFWFQKSAEQNFPDALFNVGNCYLNGYGVEADEFACVKYYKMAAEAGSTAAMYNLGVCYAKGVGVEGGQPNEELSNRYFQMAADGGNEAALAAFAPSTRTAGG